MTDYVKQIPAWAYINFQIFQDAREQGNLKDSISRVEKMYKLPYGSLDIENSAYIISLLYCLIVVPKELRYRDGLSKFLEETKLSPITNLFSISIKPDKFDEDPLFELIYHLRNSISHVRFSIDEIDEKRRKFIFWDKKHENAPINFECSIELPGLMMFLSIIGQALANFVNQK
ncbi:MAG: hypothetical protein KF758_10135 [Anaerolineales bacterium]|nr:hypothetical protein [Anaerolineales bacterium]